jgi:hypothetical protein
VTSAACFEINAPAVAGEIIDGEAIILHLPKGHYFSSEGSGALVWAGIERRATIADIARAMSGRYGLGVDEAVRAVEGFVEELQKHDLVRPAASIGDVGDLETLPGGGEYAPPAIEIYTDMQDLLLLDPIHDVDAAGWPVAPDQTRA